MIPRKKGQEKQNDFPKEELIIFDVDANTNRSCGRSQAGIPHSELNRDRAHSIACNSPHIVGRKPVEPDQWNATVSK